MTQRTLLDVIGAVMAELGQQKPLDVISATDAQTQQLRALYSELVDDVAGSHNWQCMLETYTFSTAIGQGTYDVPADYKKLSANTFWDLTNMRRLQGPANAAEVARIRALKYADMNAYVFQIRGSKLILTPTPKAVVQLTFDYKSAFSIIDSGTHARKEQFSRNDDTVVFDNRLMKAGLKARFLGSKGLDNRAAVSNYNAAWDAAVSADSPGHAYNIAPDSDCLPSPNFGDGRVPL